nr:hypothetical protein Iba_chr05eCG2200 [Ipomoea batatas]
MLPSSSQVDKSRSSEAASDMSVSRGVMLEEESSIDIASAASSSAALFAAASCLALSSSIETRSASASSGSKLGSTPNSKPDTPPAEAAAAAAANPLPPSPSPEPGSCHHILRFHLFHHVPKSLLELRPSHLLLALQRLLLLWCLTQCCEPDQRCPGRNSRMWLMSKLCDEKKRLKSSLACLP